MGWKADPVEFLGCRLPLHEMQRVDVVDFKAIPDVFSFQRRLRPVIALARHQFPVVVFPVGPFELRIEGNMFVQNDYGEIHF